MHSYPSKSASSRARKAGELHSAHSMGIMDVTPPGPFVGRVYFSGATPAMTRRWHCAAPSRYGEVIGCPDNPASECLGTPRLHLHTTLTGH